MSKVIAFASQKGGVGKTTLLMLTASACHNRLKKKVLVIDCDQQGSVKHIYNKENNQKSSGKKPYPVIAFDWQRKNSESNFSKTIALAKAKHDLIFLDLPSKSQNSADVYNSLVASDAIIVPIIASKLDVHSTITFLNTLPQIATIRSKNDLDTEIYGVVNKKDNTQEHKRKLLERLAGIGNLKLFHSPISYIADYRRKISTVRDYTNPKLDHEFNSYFEEFTTKCLV